MAVWRVMTWNIRGSAQPDLDVIADRIREQRPDVVALQEVLRRQARDLAARLGWRHTWARKHYPYTPLVWWRAEGLAIVSPHPLTAVASGSISPGTSTWTFRHRIVLAATVGADLRVYDTHLAAHDEPDERIAQARRVAERVTADAAPWCVVCGDLNAANEPEVIRELHAVGLRDPGGASTHPSHAPQKRFDYVLVPESARVTQQWEPDGGDDWAELSDHLPVVVELAT